jgi:hypothetical protein
MQLLMAMKQSIARVVCDEVHGNAIKGHYVDDVFEQPAYLPISNTSYLKGMSVQMHGVLVAASIAKHKPVALTVSNLERRDIGPGSVVDGPSVEL